MSVKTLPGKGILEIVWLLVKTAAAVNGAIVSAAAFYFRHYSLKKTQVLF